ncbi:hypothetical protein D5086_017392 [Populus alba]|uniref:Uncharacterized protein n=1 Tax=Populus alba TaxID=43335 RepID=A0ACC4BX92_POPAL
MDARFLLLWIAAISHAYLVYGCKSTCCCYKQLGYNDVVLVSFYCVAMFAIEELHGTYTVLTTTFSHPQGSTPQYHGDPSPSINHVFVENWSGDDDLEDKEVNFDSYVEDYVGASKFFTSSVVVAPPFLLLLLLVSNQPLLLSLRMLTGEGIKFCPLLVVVVQDSIVFMPDDVLDKSVLADGAIFPEFSIYAPSVVHPYSPSSVSQLELLPLEYASCPATLPPILEVVPLQLKISEVEHLLPRPLQMYGITGTKVDSRKPPVWETSNLDVGSPDEDSRLKDLVVYDVLVFTFKEVTPTSVMSPYPRCIFYCRLNGAETLMGFWLEPFDDGHSVGSSMSPPSDKLDDSPSTAMEMVNLMGVPLFSIHKLLSAEASLDWLVGIPCCPAYKGSSLLLPIDAVGYLWDY